MSDYLSICEHAARAGGQVLLDWQGRFQVREKSPSDLVTEADFASQETIRGILLGEFPEHQFLGEESPLDASATEQSDQNDSPYRWIVDPLDGTTNYVHGLHCFCVSIALEREGEILVGTIFDPVSNECYTASAGGGAWLNGQPLKVSEVTQLSEALVVASFGTSVSRDSIELSRFAEIVTTSQAVRRLGSAALSLAYLAAGRLDSYWAITAKAWDVAAGVLLVQEAGGIVTSMAGKPFDLETPTFAASATPELNTSLVAALARAQ